MSSRHTFEHEGVVYPVQVVRAGEGWTVTVGTGEAARTYAVSALVTEQGRLALEVDGARHLAHVVAGQGKYRDQRFVAVDGATWALSVAEPGAGRRRAGGEKGGGSLTAGMPGQVLDVLVRPGDVVEQGQTLVLLEAMKMELRITAPQAGTVSAVHCRAGETVDRGQKLVEMGEIAAQIA